MASLSAFVIQQLLHFSQTSENKRTFAICDDIIAVRDDIIEFCGDIRMVKSDRNAACSSDFRTRGDWKK